MEYGARSTCMQYGVWSMDHELRTTKCGKCILVQVPSFWRILFVSFYQISVTCHLWAWMLSSSSAQMQSRRLSLTNPQKKSCRMWKLWWWSLGSVVTLIVLVPTATFLKRLSLPQASHRGRSCRHGGRQRHSEAKDVVLLEMGFVLCAHVGYHTS